MDLLDPKQDVVFKLLFADKRNERLLISLIESVLEPASPIEGVTVLDPEVRKEHVDARGIVLDVLVRLVDGARVNLEMQCDRRGAIADRWLYNWARLFSDGIRRGEEFADLAPVVCVVFLDVSIGRRFGLASSALAPRPSYNLWRARIPSWPRRRTLSNASPKTPPPGRWQKHAERRRSTCSSATHARARKDVQRGCVR